MRLKRGFASLSLMAVLAGCGLYTNIPAQVQLDAPPSSVVATVDYKVQQGTISAEINNPTVTLAGEPGSIGVTYDEIAIEYLPQGLNLNPSTVVIAGSIRVPSSHQFDENGNAVVGTATTELPIISSQVVALGSPNTDGRINSQISAKVTLSGTDDAGFPASYTFFVPINFLTSEIPA